MAFNLDESNPLPGYPALPSPGYGQPLTNHRLLHIYHKGWNHRHVEIVGSDKRTLLYKIHANRGGLFSSKPHVSITSAASHRVIGTINFHQMSTTIDLVVHGQPVALWRLGLFTSAHKFESIASRRTLKWKGDGVMNGGAMICLDERHQPVARLLTSTWARKKDAKFLLSSGVEGKLMDEIVATGFAMLQYRRRQRKKAPPATHRATSGFAG